ncbi:hypothetical protein [Phocaeicola faecium]|uniref:Uncharacterized protein n=1 Tax=Phocaeicola faecium TaxID=2762213 RepID=A0ABR8VDW6_9BACT|nr:hypothetical protein [Phocaeicola faecium]MBD8002972.1 hypothetical protein [Phocaeicola faecium]
MNWKRFGLWMIVAVVLSTTTLLILTALGCERSLAGLISACACGLSPSVSQLLIKVWGKCK